MSQMPEQENHTGEVHSSADSTAEYSFDELARGLASGTVSRRKALKWMGGALLGGVLASIPGVAVAAPPPGRGRPSGSQGCPNVGEIRVGGRCQCQSGQELCGGACVPSCG